MIYKGPIIKRAPAIKIAGVLLIRGVVALFFYFFGMGSVVHPVPPFKKEFNPSGPTCFLNKSAAESLALRSRGVETQDFPSPPSPNVLVIRVDFTDEPMTLTLTESESFFTKVRDFYVENSYGVFLPTFTVTNTVHRLGALATYGADCGSDIACHDNLLRQDAIASENAAGRNFAQFDQIMIYHAGNGQESSGQGNDIWSVYFPGNFIADGKIFNGFTIVPEKEAGNVDPLGVVCHEYGHQLGLPDLYDISVPGGASTVGTWDLMDYPYAAASGGAPGSNPSHLGAWSKKFLGFLTPSEITNSGNRSLGSVNVSSVASRFPVYVSDEGSDNESFLIEYRNILSTAAYDKGIPGSGILIWHIDESIALNPVRLTNNDINTPSFSAEPHRGVEVVEADFTENYAGPGHGEAADIFTSGISFLSPLSDAFNGIPTGILLTAISGIGTESARFSVEIPPISTFTISSSLLFSTSVLTADGFISVQIPPGTFNDGVSFFISSISSTSLSQVGSDSFAGSFDSSGVGGLVGAQSNAQPRQGINLSLGFSGNSGLTALSTEDLSKITLARFDVANRVWVPVLSSVDPIDQIVSATIDHLSLFQIMKTKVASNPDQVRIYPNPMRPSLGPAYKIINFSNLPPNTMVKIFSVSGEMIKNFTAGPAGTAHWDGKNEYGQKAGSGIYFVLFDGPNGSGKKVSKVAIER